MEPKSFIKLIAPPFLIHAYNYLLDAQSANQVTGNYSSWEEAKRASTGYDCDVILEKTKEALLKIKKDEAAYERDSVIFDKIQYSWPLLAGLMWVAAKSAGRLNVLDFGGSLGSTFFQNRDFLFKLPQVRWNIVEQPNHVEVGKEFFEDDRLKFFSSIKECVAASQPNVVILSSVLQYLEKPYDVLGELMELDCEHIIIDRTPFWDGDEDRLCIQHVPPSIFEASYPTWIFSRMQFLASIELNWNIVAQFVNLEAIQGPVEVEFRGFILTLRSNGA